MGDEQTATREVRFSRDRGRTAMGDGQTGTGEGLRGMGDVDIWRGLMDRLAGVRVMGPIRCYRGSGGEGKQTAHYPVTHPLGQRSSHHN